MRTPQRLLPLLVAILAVPLHATITGSVMNADGQPIAGAKISVYGPETLSARRERLASKTPDRPPLVTATADSNGNFRVEPPKEQTIVDLRVDVSGYAPDAIRLQSDDDAGAVVLTKADPKSGTIKAGGKPVASATVVVNGGAIFIAPQHDLEFLRVDGDSFDMPPEELPLRNLRSRLLLLLHSVADKRLDVRRRNAGD